MAADSTRQSPTARIVKRYQRFAEHEARGVSARYEDYATAVASDERALAFLAKLPADKQQPNLVFAAIRSLFGEPTSGATLVDQLITHPGVVREVILARRVQTNEPARCATLLPVLARLPQPLALIEIGASAGLCLLPDRYGYDFGRIRVPPACPSDVEAPVFRCEANADTPLPATAPRIAWRAGLDLHPIDVRDADAVGWLETLVWPEHRTRAVQLGQALRVAAQSPPRVVQGDLRSDLDRLLVEAPTGATPVVFHSAVLSYLPSRDAIDRFADHVRSLGVTWVSNESPLVLPELVNGIDQAMMAGRFLLSVDGVPVALTGPHGQSIDWLG